MTAAEAVYGCIFSHGPMIPSRLFEPVVGLVQDQHLQQQGPGHPKAEDEGISPPRDKQALAGAVPKF
jgi:hypothetical protein